MTPTDPLQSNILIVDDLPANLKVLTTMLADHGHRVRPAINGQLALIAVQQALPDLILLDIAMPGLDGYEVCRRLKADEKTTDIPIIFISAHDETEDKVKAFAMGGVDYITKPFQVEEVLTRVNTHLTIHHLQKNLQEKNQLLQEKNNQLQEALDSIKKLKNLLPICANCKKIRDDEGFWKQVELYISEELDVQFSHGICPDCARELYPEYYEK